MANLITSLNASRASVTTGERRFAQRVQDLLDDEWLCWYDVPVGNRRRYPDFVVLHPDRGLLLLEVKDWKINEVLSLDKIQARILFGGVPRTVANPLEQARQCTMELVNQLKNDPLLCHEGGRHRGGLVCPYGWGIVFPSITRKQLDEALTTEEQELVLPGRFVICRDEMTESMSSERFEQNLSGMFQYQFIEPMSRPQIDRIRWHLFPEVRINAVQADLFVDEPAPDLVKVLDLQQEQLARNLGSGHRIIHGVAGSGKTLILGYRCTQLAKSLSKPMLILCYNVSLATRLLRFVEEHGLVAHVHVHHFHEWCGLQLRKHQVKIPAGDLPPWEQQVKGVIDGVDQGLIPRGQYGAVLIDEGHDFAPDWLKLVVQMVDPVTDSLLLLYDDAQSIYKNAKGLGFSLSSVGVKASGRTTILRLNYRNSREILKFAYDFAKDGFDTKSTDDDHIPLIEPESAGIPGPPPRFMQGKNSLEELDSSIASIRSWLIKGVPPQEIAIIYFEYKQGLAVSKRLEIEGLDHLWMADRTRKKEFDPAKPRLTVLTAQSSKGLEFQCVVIVGIGHLPDAPEEFSTQNRLLYVAMTRAKRELILTASAPNVFVSRLITLAG